MANIIFTNKCNIQCPFCFAKENNTKSSISQDFSILKSWEISSFITNKIFRFCGGEPTANPEIINVIEKLLEHGYEIFIMTNGIWPEKFSSFISSLDSKYITKIGYLFNILDPTFYRKNEFSIIKNTLSIVNPLKSTLGFTIYDRKFNFDYLIDLSVKYNIRNIRWSVAAPNISGNNKSIESYYKEISSRLYEVFDYCLKNRIRIHSDCNYIQPCYWEKEKITDLLIRASGNISFSCSQGSPVDIDANGNAWRCFGLYSVLSAKIHNFNNELELEKYFTRRVQLLDNIPAYEECKECIYWHSGCDGGCYVFRVKRILKQKPDLILFPVDDDNEILNCKPYRNNNYLIQDKNDEVQILSQNKLIINEDENVISFLKEIDGEKTISDLIHKWQSNFSNFESAKKTVVKQCRDLFDKDMIKINYSYPIKVERRPSYK